MTPEQWLPINAVLLLLTGGGALIHPSRVFRIVFAGFAMSWCFWIGWNLSQAGCR